MGGVRDNTINSEQGKPAREGKLIKDIQRGAKYKD